MFQMIENIIHGIQPPAVSCDFELGLINAAKGSKFNYKAYRKKFSRM